MKMHWAARTLLAPGHRGGAGGSDPRLVLRAVQGAISYMVSLIRSRCDCHASHDGCSVEKLSCNDLYVLDTPWSIA